MEANAAWLCQGDVFSAAPVLDLGSDASGALTATLLTGPAVLLTHDCAMDKSYPDGSLRAERLQFARLRSIQGLTADRAGNLRGTRLAVEPSEALWLGEVEGHGECFIYLSDPYFLPSAYFEPTCVQYEVTEADGSPSRPRATPRAHDTRFGRLDPEQIDLLRRKMIAFWTRSKPAPPAA